MGVAELTQKQKQDRDMVALVICREAVRGRSPCYQCKDAATRLVTSGLVISVP